MDKNKENIDFFSGVTEDFSFFSWYKGENKNPYIGDKERPLAEAFWNYEREFFMSFLDRCDIEANIKTEYENWKKGFIGDHLPGWSANPYGDEKDWEKAFETGKTE